ncbi:MAG: hypothetical protein L6V95_13565 [Candidatus Melainabacteria bacterium]|nr:MAG: hypothetical protein L6V95_13565 [Candidatus Melainabacteria bacterium]
MLVYYSHNLIKKNIKKWQQKVVNGDFSNENYSSIDFTKLNAKSIAMGYRLNQALDTLVKIIN